MKWLINKGWLIETDLVKMSFNKGMHKVMFDYEGYITTSPGVPVEDVQAIINLLIDLQLV